MYNTKDWDKHDLFVSKCKHETGVGNTARPRIVCYICKKVRYVNVHSRSEDPIKETLHKFKRNHQCDGWIEYQPGVYQ